MENGEIVDFDKLKVTTMTLIMGLSQHTIKEAVFHTLPIVKINTEGIRPTSKCKLPHCKIPGSIISMRYGNMVRGIIKKNPFKNAITIDISTKVKNISVKLSSNSIQMCGASSEQDGLEAATYIVEYITNIQKILDLMQADPEHAQACCQYVANVTKGEELEREVIRSKPLDNNTEMLIYDMVIDHAVICPPTDIPVQYNREIVAFLSQFWLEFLYHSDMMNKLKYLLTLREVIVPEQHTVPLHIRNYDLVMVNYNYKLGFEVNRSNLSKYIDRMNGFTTRYNNSLSTSVTIELLYEPTNRSDGGRKKNKVPHHTFLVYKSGAVTQSGPGGQLMKDAYYLFMNTIMEIKDLIVYDPVNGQTPYRALPESSSPEYEEYDSWSNLIVCEAE